MPVALLRNAQHSQVDSRLWQVFPNCLQHSLEFSFVGCIFAMLSADLADFGLPLPISPVKPSILYISPASDKSFAAALRLQLSMLVSLIFIAFCAHALFTQCLYFASLLIVMSQLRPFSTFSKVCASSFAAAAAVRLTNNKARFVGPVPQQQLRQRAQASRPSPLIRAVAAAHIIFSCSFYKVFK